MAQAYTSGAVPDLVVAVGLQHTLKHGAWLLLRKERGTTYDRQPLYPATPDVPAN